MVHGASVPLIKWRLQHVKCATKTDQIRTLFSRNIWESLKSEISSFLLFRVEISGLQIIKYYSHKHKLHFLVTFVYDFACFTLRHGQDLIQFHQSTCINNITYYVVEREFVYMLNEKRSCWRWIDQSIYREQDWNHYI